MLSLRPLHQHFAAEIAGLDLTKPLRPAQFAELRDAWNRYGVLVIRGQAIAESHQIAFAKQFGTLERFPPAADGRPGGPELVRVSNAREDGSFFESTDPPMKYLAMTRAWHKDTSYKRVPGFATILRAVQVPDEGGETEFIDLRAAFDGLPRGEQDRLKGLAAPHSYGQAMKACGIEGSVAPSRVAAVHPLIAWHDEGRRSLFLSPLHMHTIEGMDDNDSGALLAELVQWSTKPSLIYRHVWRKDDVLLWDNRTTMHRGMPCADRAVVRTLHRVVINGEGYVERLFAPPEATLPRRPYARE